MSVQSPSDLLMKFVDKNGKTIDGESSTELALKPSKLSEGFKTGKMFEIASFTFKTGLGGDDYNDAEEKLHDNLEKLAESAEVSGLKMRPRSYKKLYEGGAQPQSLNYPVDMRPVTFSRFVDRTSSVLLTNCIQRRVFKSATVIKRKAAGTERSGEAFFRIDFTEVLLTGIDWSNDEPIREDCEFVCRGVLIRYLPQMPDGTFGGARSAKWTSSDDVRLQTV